MMKFLKMDKKLSVHSVLLKSTYRVVRKSKRKSSIFEYDIFGEFTFLRKWLWAAILFYISFDRFLSFLNQHIKSYALYSFYKLCSNQFVHKKSCCKNWFFGEEVLIEEFLGMSVGTYVLWVYIKMWETQVLISHLAVSRFECRGRSREPS